MEAIRMKARNKKKTVARSLALAMVAMGILPLNGCKGGAGGAGGAGGGLLSGVGRFMGGAVNTMGSMAGSALGGIGNLFGSILGGRGGAAAGPIGQTAPSPSAFQGLTGGALNSGGGGIGKPYRASSSGGIGVTPGPGN
jgi:hypothetical protein